MVCSALVGYPATPAGRLRLCGHINKVCAGQVGFVAGYVRQAAYIKVGLCAFVRRPMRYRLQCCCRLTCVPRHGCPAVAPAHSG